MKHEKKGKVNIMCIIYVWIPWYTLRERERGREGKRGEERGRVREGKRREEAGGEERVLFQGPITPSQLSACPSSAACSVAPGRSPGSRRRSSSPTHHGARGTPPAHERAAHET